MLFGIPSRAVPEVERPLTIDQREATTPHHPASPPPIRRHYHRNLMTQPPLSSHPQPVATSGFRPSQRQPNGLCPPLCRPQPSSRPAKAPQPTGKTYPPRDRHWSLALRSTLEPLPSSYPL